MRERWFLAEGGRRCGPLPLAELLDALRDRADPRAALVWRRGLAGWSRVEHVPELAANLAALLACPEARGPQGELAAPGVGGRAAPAARGIRRRVLLCAGLAAAVALGYAGWRLPVRPASEPPQLHAERASSLPTAPVDTPRAAAPSPTAAPSPLARERATPSPVSATTVAPAAPREAELPAPERRQLQAAAAWSADRLELMVRNGSSWSITALRVRVFRFAAEEFVEDARPVMLLPREEAPVAGVAEAGEPAPGAPRTPGLAPLATGSFVGRAGAPPESFRFEIESARGYPPR